MSKIAPLQGRTPSANHQSNPNSIALSPNTLRTTRATLRPESTIPYPWEPVEYHPTLWNSTLWNTYTLHMPLKHFNFTFKLGPSSFRTLKPSRNRDISLLNFSLQTKYLRTLANHSRNDDPLPLGSLSNTSPYLSFLEYLEYLEYLEFHELPYLRAPPYFEPYIHILWTVPSCGRSSRRHE
jgi:hypothetical protein